MKTQIIAQFEPSDRNIYMTFEDGVLISVNYSQGLGDIDLHFLTTHNEKLTNYIILELALDDRYNYKLFFPSLQWDEQVAFIDETIWKLIREENERAELIKSILLIESEMAKLQNQVTELRNKLNTYE